MCDNSTREADGQRCESEGYCCPEENSPEVDSLGCRYGDRKKNTGTGTKHRVDE